MVLPRMMDNIEAMSRVIRWLDGRLDGRDQRTRLQPSWKAAVTGPPASC